MAYDTSGPVRSAVVFAATQCLANLDKVPKGYC